MTKCLPSQMVTFFTRLDFKVSYLPGAKNQRADAHCCQYDPLENNVQPGAVLPLLCFVEPVVWELDKTL